MSARNRRYKKDSCNRAEISGTALFFNFFIGEPAYLKFIEILVVILMVIIGLISGNMLISGKEAGKPADIALAYSLDVFEPTAPGSVGSAYLLVMEEES